MTDPIKRRIQSAHDANGKRDERFVGLKHLAHIRKPSFILADQLNDMLAENNTKVRIRCQSFHPKLCVWICIFSIHHLPSGSKICPPTIIRKKNITLPKTNVPAPPCQRPTTNQVKNRPIHVVIFFPIFLPYFFFHFLDNVCKLFVFRIGYMT